MSLYDRIVLTESGLDPSVEVLYVFDMDDTLIHHASKKAGREQWEKLTGKEWPHGQKWWSVPDTLKPPFKFARVNQTKAALKKAKSDPRGKVVVMTGRIAIKEFKTTIPKLLRKLGAGDFKFNDNLFLKTVGEEDTLAWKKRMLRGFTKRFPNLREINMWDDRGKHVSEFRSYITKTLKLDGKVTHVTEPTPAHIETGVQESFPNRPWWSMPFADLEPHQLAPAETPKQARSEAPRSDPLKPMANPLPGNVSPRAKQRAGGGRWEKRNKKPKSAASLLGRIASFTRGRGDEPHDRSGGEGR